ncbi:LOW QUALITY PROTEIN: gamma-aminobutyric acid type B receptor subunit 2-like [Saccoglossus kowalevskii]
MMNLRILCWSIVVIAVPRVQPIEEANNTSLYILGLFPFDTPIWAGGQSYLPATQMALQHINARDDILPGYELKMMWRDSKCDGGSAVDAMFRLLDSEPVKIAILGPACSTASQATGQVAWHRNLVQMSYSAAAPSLSDKTTYPYFSRIKPPDTFQNTARLALLQHYDWKRVGAITDGADIWSTVTNDMIGKMREYGMEIASSERFYENPSVQMQNMKNKDVRIIVGNFYTPTAMMVFCEAYKLGMYGAKYVWVVQGWYTSTMIDSSLSQGNLECTREQIYEVMEGMFSTSDFRENPDSNKRGISGMIPSEYLPKFDEFINATGSDLVGYTSSSAGYDSMWALALALHNAMVSLEQSDGNKRLEDFNYEDKYLADLIMASLMNVSIHGVSANIQFNIHGDPLTDLKVQQFQGNGPPNDRIYSENVITQIPVYIYVLMSLLAAIGIVCAMCFLFLNIKYREERIFKMSSPTINNFIFGGCILTYLTVMAAPFEGSYLDPLLCCKAGNYLLMIGFSSAYGALFSKTWRVHVLFTNKQFKKKAIKDIKLISFVCILLTIDIITIALWELIDPLRIELYETHETDFYHVNNNEHVEDHIIIYQVESCESSRLSYWIGVIYSTKATLLMFGVFLAWETRKVTIELLNDSRYIGICIYNVVILCVPAALLAYVLRLQPMVSYSIISVFVIFGTSVTQCLVFLPKIIAYRDGDVLPWGHQSHRSTHRTHNIVSTTTSALPATTTDVAIQCNRYSWYEDGEEQSVL